MGQTICAPNLIFQKFPLVSKKTATVESLREIGLPVLNLVPCNFIVSALLVYQFSFYSLKITFVYCLRILYMDIKCPIKSYLTDFMVSSLFPPHF